MYMISLIRYLLNHPLGDSSRFRVESELVSFISSYILRETRLNTKSEEEEESEEDFQKRVDEGVRNMRTWEWGDDNQKLFLNIAECVVRDCRSIQWLCDCGPPALNLKSFSYIQLILLLPFGTISSA